MYLILNKERFTFHLQCKHSDTFGYCKYEELSYPNIRNVRPVLVTLLKMQCQDSQSSCENATPSSCTSPLASYKEVPTMRLPRKDSW